MKEELIKSTIVIFLIFIISYLIATFIAWDFNPSHWSILGRFFGIMLGISLSGLFIVHNMDI